MILDGEIVALGGGIRPSFSDLQRRIHARQPAAALLAAVPVTYLVFDLLALSGRRLLASPYEQRRETLESLGLHLLPGVDVPPGFPGDGPAVLAVSREHGLEGIVLKRMGSPYVPGRSSLWLKIKHLNVLQVVIGGWIPRGATRAEAVRSLLVGVPGPAGLMYRGQVGTGFTEPARHDLARRLAASALPSCPFSGRVPADVAGRARWVLPLLAGEVGFTEQTPAGQFRHPVWRGLLSGPG
ncbi:MAG: non-homologous end-joining DNA ligase [Streptosporangiaceae bacterium]